MDRIFTLHADHEQNASTSTVRLASSSGANPFACIAAGIACLWGPAHGGANQACLEMLKEIGSPENIPEYIARAKDKNDPFRLMGFGHRVYKNFDPRATVMKQSADEVLDLLGVENNPVLATAKALEEAALSDPYFAEKKLFPNVDFYSGIILEAMGFPTSMFHPDLRAVAHRRLGEPVEGNADRSAEQDRPPAPALPRRDRARLRGYRKALSRSVLTAQGRLRHRGRLFRDRRTSWRSGLRICQREEDPAASSLSKVRGSTAGGGRGAYMWIARSKASSTLSCIISLSVGCGKTVCIKSSSVVSSWRATI